MKTESEIKDFKEALIAILLVPFVAVPLLVILLPFAMFNAWAVGTMYAWFVLPLGAPELSFWHVFGLLLLIGLLRQGNGTKDNDSISESVIKLVLQIFIVLMMVLVGFIVKGWI